MSTVTLRPDGVGNYTNIPSQNPGSVAHWTLVDEAVADGNTTMVYTPSNTTGYRDSYTLENTALAGTINSVTVHHVTYLTPGTGHILPFLRLGGVDNDGTEVEVTAAWVADSEAITRPGGGSWSWADINSLEVGARLKGNAGAVCRLTQMYVVVDYSESAEAIMNQFQKSNLGADLFNGVLQ